jgi:hypothetical protein
VDAKGGAAVTRSEPNPSDAPGEHVHEWRVALRIRRNLIARDNGTVHDHGPALLLRCGCGNLGMVVDPSPAEMRRATKPYRWFAHHRVRPVVNGPSKGPQGTELGVRE